MFPLLSFDQANPILTGYGKILQQRQQQLRNNQLGIQNEYLPDMTQAQLAELRARIPYYQAQANLAQQQAAYYPYETAAKFDPVTQMLMGRYFVNNFIGGGQRQPSPQSAPPALQSNDGGMTVQPAGASASNIPPYLLRPQSQDPAAQAAALPVLPGGLTPAQGQQVLTQMNAPPNIPAVGGPANSLYDSLYNVRFKNAVNQLTKDPTIGSQKSGAGGTYTDLTTGQQYTTDTNKNTTVDQQTIAAIDRVKPLLNSLSANLSPFQTLQGQAALRAGQLGNFLNINSKYGAKADQYATGQASLKMSAESLLKGWGLNVTNESLQTMQEAVMPRFGESSQGYQNRIIETLKQLEENQRQAAGRLKGGINLDTAGNQTAQSAPQIQATKTVRGKTYYLVNGSWHE